MPRKNPLQNPKYSFILKQIFMGVDTPATITSAVNRAYNSSKEPIETSNNLSMKLINLKKYNLITCKRYRSINHSSTSKYKICYEGLVLLAIKRFIPKAYRRIAKSRYLSYLSIIMEVYIGRRIRDDKHKETPLGFVTKKEPNRPKLIVRPFKELSFEKVPIHYILEDWIKGIGLQHYNFTQIRNYLKPIRKKKKIKSNYLSDGSLQLDKNYFGDECTNYLFRTFSNDILLAGECYIKSQVQFQKS